MFAFLDENFESLTESHWNEKLRLPNINQIAIKNSNNFFFHNFLNKS